MHHIMNIAWYELTLAIGIDVVTGSTGTSSERSNEQGLASTPVGRRGLGRVGAGRDARGSRNGCAASQRKSADEGHFWTRVLVFCWGEWGVVNE